MNKIRVFVKTNAHQTDEHFPTRVERRILAAYFQLREEPHLLPTNMKQKSLLLIALLISASTLVLAINEQETPVVAVSLDDNLLSNQQRVTHTNHQGVLQASSSKTIESVLINIREDGRTIHSNQSTNPSLHFNLPNGSYEINVIGYIDNKWAASAKMYLEISVEDQTTVPERDAKQTTPPPSLESFIDICNYHDQHQTNRIYKKGDLHFKIVYSNQARLSYTQREKELQEHQQRNHFVLLKDPQGTVHARGISEQEKEHLEKFSNKRFEVRLAEDFCRQINEVVNTYEVPPTITQEVCAEETREQLNQVSSDLEREQVISKAEELLRTECENTQQTLQNKIIAINALKLAGEEVKQILESLIREHQANEEVKEEVIQLYFLYAEEIRHLGDCHQLYLVNQAFRELDPPGYDINTMNLVTQCPRGLGTCKLYQGNRNAPIKIIFVADKYESMQSFHKDIDRSIEAIFENDLFREHQDKFSFSYLDKILHLALDANENRVDSYARPTWQETRHCAGHPILLSRDEFRSFAIRSRLSAVSWAPIRTIIIEDNSPEPRVVYSPNTRAGRVVLHEIGHQIFHLSDLYEEEGKGSRPSFTCQPSMREARNAWRHLQGVDYHYGCAFVSDNVRSAEQSIMRYHRETAQFDPASKYLVRKQLEALNT